MPDCFIIMPITTPEFSLATYSNDRDHFQHVLEHLFKPALERAEFTPISPRMQGSDVIHGEIIKNIETADLVLCDMSTLNPNVFFELGIRTAVDKPVCIVKDDATPNVPFDTTILNYHTYLSALTPWTLQKQIDDLAAHIQKSVERSNGQNTLWKYFSLSTRAALADVKPSTDSRLDLLSLQVEGLSRSVAESRFRAEPRPSADLDYSDYMLAGFLDALLDAKGPHRDSIRILRHGENSFTLDVRVGTLTSEDVTMINNFAEKRRINIEINEI